MEREPLAGLVGTFRIRSTSNPEDSPSRIRKGSHACTDRLIESVPEAIRAPKVQELIGEYLRHVQALEELGGKSRRTQDLELEISLERNFERPHEFPSKIALRVRGVNGAETLWFRDAEGDTPLRESIFKPTGGVDLFKCQLGADDIARHLQQQISKLRDSNEEVARTPAARLPAASPISVRDLNYLGTEENGSTDATILWSPGW